MALYYRVPVQVLRRLRLLLLLLLLIPAWGGRTIAAWVPVVPGAGGGVSHHPAPPQSSSLSDGGFSSSSLFGWWNIHRCNGLGKIDRFRRRRQVYCNGLCSTTALNAQSRKSPSTLSSSLSSENKKNGGRQKKGGANKQPQSDGPWNTAKRPKQQQQRKGENVPKSSWWRVFGVEVHPDRLVNPDNEEQQQQQQQQSSSVLHPAIVQALEARLQISFTNSSNNNNPPKICVVRRSLDARRRSSSRADGGTGPRFVYVLDVQVENDDHRGWRWKHQPGRLERLEQPPPQQQQQQQQHSTTHPPRDGSHPDPPNDKADPTSLAAVVDAEDFSSSSTTTATTTTTTNTTHSRPVRRVIIVGAGPAGLFCALELLKHGGNNNNPGAADVVPILLERGQPVEVRGRDIGALMHRRQLNGESNYAFGEGGAGTWSDGKLTTRIGRNSDSVRHVLETLVEYGAPAHILWEGAPHLGTDNLVRLLRRLRHDLRQKGGEIHFGTRVTGLRIREDGVVEGVDYVTTSTTSTTTTAASRKANKELPVENHPTTATTQTHQNDDSQQSVSGTMYGDAVVLATGHSARDVYEQLHAAGVQLEAKGFAVGFRVEHPQKIINRLQYGIEWGPSVVTGKTTTDALNQEYLESFVERSGDAVHHPQQHHKGILPVPSYRLATDKAYDGVQFRGAYSFCMCPGGQIVPASTDPNEVCVNGMSFSRRDSQWANSALVVTVAPDDIVLEPYRKEHGVLAGVAFQRDMERRAAAMGGGGSNMSVPVQRLTDFLEGRPSTTAPPSSYRLGVRPAACHEIYPAPLVHALRNALTEHFNRTLPGFVCPEGLLHGVETRTSSPVRVVRNPDSLEAAGCRLLFPAGEGAGFAGGIVSAAVDGMVVAEGVLACLGVLDAETGDAVGRENKRHSGGVGMMY